MMLYGKMNLKGEPVYIDFNDFIDLIKKYKFYGIDVNKNRIIFIIKRWRIKKIFGLYTWLFIELKEELENEQI